MYEMYAKFHQNWRCGFWEKRLHKTDICGFIYRIPTWILWVDLKKVHNVCWIEYLNLPFERNVMMTFCKIFTLDFYALKIVVSYQATHPSCIFFSQRSLIIFFFKIKLNFPCKNFVRHHSSLKAFDISEKIENDFNNPT